MSSQAASIILVFWGGGCSSRAIQQCKLGAQMCVRHRAGVSQQPAVEAG